MTSCQFEEASRVSDLGCGSGKPPWQVAPRGRPLFCRGKSGSVALLGHFPILGWPTLPQALGEGGREAVPSGAEGRKEGVCNPGALELP